MPTYTPAERKVLLARLEAKKKDATPPACLERMERETEKKLRDIKGRVAAQIIYGPKASNKYSVCYFSVHVCPQSTLTYVVVKTVGRVKPRQLAPLAEPEVFEAEDDELTLLSPPAPLVRQPSVRQPVATTEDVAREVATQAVGDMSQAIDMFLFGETDDGVDTVDKKPTDTDPEGRKERKTVKSTIVVRKKNKAGGHVSTKQPPVEEDGGQPLAVNPRTIYVNPLKRRASPPREELGGLEASEVSQPSGQEETGEANQVRFGPAEKGQLVAAQEKERKQELIAIGDQVWKSVLQPVLDNVTGSHARRLIRCERRYRFVHCIVSCAH